MIDTVLMKELMNHKFKFENSFFKWMDNVIYSDEFSDYIDRRAVDRNDIMLNGVSSFFKDFLVEYKNSFDVLRVKRIGLNGDYITIEFYHNINAEYLPDENNVVEYLAEKNIL